MLGAYFLGKWRRFLLLLMLVGVPCHAPRHWPCHCDCGEPRHDPFWLLEVGLVGVPPVVRAVAGPPAKTSGLRSVVSFGLPIIRLLEFVTQHLVVLPSTAATHVPLAVSG